MEHTVEYEQDLSTKDLAVVAATLKAALAKNGDALAVGNKTFAAAGTPEMLFGDKPGIYSHEPLQLTALV